MPAVSFQPLESAMRTTTAFGAFVPGLLLAACATNHYDSGLPLPPNAQIRAFLDINDTEGLETYFEIQRRYFEAHSGKYDAALDQAADAINARWQPRLLAEQAACAAIAWPAPRDNWRALGDALSVASSDLRRYAAIQLVESRHKRAPAYSSLTQMVDERTSQISADAASELRAENFDNGRNFFVDYPTPEDSLVDQMAAQLRNSFDPATNGDRVPTIAVSYQLFIKRNDALRQELTREVSEVLTAKIKAGSLSDVLAYYYRAHEVGLANAKLPFTVSVLTLNVEGKPFKVNIGLSKDAVDWQQLTVADLQNGRSNSDFVIAMGPTRVDFNRTVGNYKDLQSRFLSGYREEPNPSYTYAALRLQGAQEALANARTNYAVAPAGFGQLGAAIALRRAMDDFNAAQSDYAGTPQTTRTAVYEPYTFQTADISISKSVTWSIFVGPKSGPVEKFLVPLEASHVFTVAYKIDDRDPDSLKLSGKYQREKEAEDWESQDINGSLGQVLTGKPERLLNQSWSSAASSLVSAQLAILPTKLPQTNTAYSVNDSGKSDARSASVVVVRTADRMGAGFFVTNNLIVTNAHVVTGQHYVSIKTFDGQSISGKVENEDRRRDLALIRVSGIGTPVVLSRKDVLVGSSVDVIGHPKGLEYSLTRGIVSQVRELPPVSGIGGGLVEYIQLDASISPGNSGGPLFQNGEVIGVATWKVSATDAENLNFAIHRDELFGFLRENGISP